MESFEVIGLRLDLVVTMSIVIPIIALAVFAGVMRFRSGMEHLDSGWGLPAIFGYAFGTAALIVLVCIFIPFQSAYHHWYSTTGTVESVTNIFEGGSGEISPGYVVELDSVEKPMVFTDPRILRELDEEVNVSCSLEWVPAGVDRLNCWLAE